MSDSGNQFTVQGKQLICAHCGGNRFIRREAQLNTPLMTFLNMDWLNKSAEVFVCAACGHLEWFIDPPMTLQDDAATPTECMSCGETIPPGKDKCHKCGWTYKL